MQKKTAYYLLAAIIIAGFVIRLALFLRTPYVSGVDGGYYAYQVAAITEYNQFDWSIFYTNPVIFYVSAFFALFFGVNTGVAIATSLFSVLTGLSIYILAQYLFKDHRTSLIAAFLVVFSPLALRMMADVRKNVAGLFFLPLILYFILKSADDKRNLIGVAVFGLLGVLSHPSVIIAGFIMIAYLALHLSMKRAVDKDELIVVLILAVPALIVAIISPDQLASGLAWVTGGIEKGGVGDTLGWMIHFLLIVAIPGTCLCAKRQNKEDIFLLAWIIISFLMTLLGICGNQAWRFNLMFFAPLAIAAGITFNWLNEKSSTAAYAALAIVFAVSLMQFTYFGLTDSQMRPMFNQNTMHALEESRAAIPEGAIIYTTTQAHPTYWIKYFYGPNVTEQAADKNNTNLNSNLSAGNQVFMVTLDSSPKKEPGLESVFSKDGVTVYNRTATLNPPSSPPEKSGGATDEKEGYDFRRLRYISTYLILPYELVLLIDPPYKEIFLVLFGFAGSALIIGLLLSLAVRAVNPLGPIAEYSLLVLFIILMTYIYIFMPNIFWGQQLLESNPPVAGPQIGNVQQSPDAMPCLCRPDDPGCRCRPGQRTDSPTQEPKPFPEGKPPEQHFRIDENCSCSPEDPECDCRLPPPPPQPGPELTPQPPPINDGIANTSPAEGMSGNIS
ncbi:glycosyltransferase family 39 protein [Candidatus Woesearchaeota archaeon]|nr:glycosyltransferase family 39 protein [Candidatus Woesearchaeota archaeon]